MHRNLNPHTWIHQNRHSSGQNFEILPLTHECTAIIIPQVNAPKSYPSHKNAPKWTSSRKCTGILPLTHECTQIVTPQVNSPESYPSHMNALKSSSLKTVYRNLTPHTWMHQNCHSSDKCTEILLHKFLGYNIRNPTPHTWMHWNNHPSSKCTRILPLTHECIDIVTPQVKAPKSYPSHMNAQKSGSLK